MQDLGAHSLHIIVFPRAHYYSTVLRHIDQRNGCGIYCQPTPAAVILHNYVNHRMYGLAPCRTSGTSSNISVSIRALIVNIIRTISIAAGNAAIAVCSGGSVSSQGFLGYCGPGRFSLYSQCSLGRAGGVVG